MAALSLSGSIQRLSAGAGSAIRLNAGLSHGAIWRWQRLTGWDFPETEEVTASHLDGAGTQVLYQQRKGLNIGLAGIAQAATEATFDEARKAMITTLDLMIRGDEGVLTVDYPTRSESATVVRVGPVDVIPIQGTTSFRWRFTLLAQDPTKVFG